MDKRTKDNKGAKLEQGCGKRRLPAAKWLGQVYITRGVAGPEDAPPGEAFSRQVAAAELVRRHGAGDWGDLDDEDRAANDEALAHGDRILSAYNNVAGHRTVWVITEWDRSATTVLLPEEY